jgi:hypothetical protein
MLPYSYDNLADKDNIENKVFVVANEAINAGEGRRANWDKLISYITDATINIEDKYMAKRTAQNVLNLLFCTSNSFPVNIGSSDRRYPRLTNVICHTGNGCSNHSMRQTSMRTCLHTSSHVI